MSTHERKKEEEERNTCIFRASPAFKQARLITSFFFFLKMWLSSGLSWVKCLEILTFCHVCYFLWQIYFDWRIKNLRFIGACVAGGFLVCFSFLFRKLRGQTSCTKAEPRSYEKTMEEGARERLRRVSVFFPLPPPPSFLVWPRFSFRATVSLTLRNTNERSP